MTECTHQWQTCPVHGRADGDLPPFKTIVTCLYGGMQLKDGGTWDERTSGEVVDRVLERLEGLLT